MTNLQVRDEELARRHWEIVASMFLPVIEVCVPARRGACVRACRVRANAMAAWTVVAGVVVRWQKDATYTDTVRE